MRAGNFLSTLTSSLGVETLFLVLVLQSVDAGRI